MLPRKTIYIQTIMHKIESKNMKSGENFFFNNNNNKKRHSLVKSSHNLKPHDLLYINFQFIVYDVFNYNRLCILIDI